MKTNALRLYGKNDLRFEEFELPAISHDEIRAQVVSDSICMSTYKAAIQGEDHKRVPDDIAINPIIIGHEFAGKIVEVGSKWKNQFEVGQKFSIQPNINYLGKGYAPGYSFSFFGGDATFINIPSIVMEKGFLLPYFGKSYYKASLAEPMSCIVAAFRAQYHIDQETYEHTMGIKEGGNMAILAGCGPMGLGAIDFALNGDKKPKRLVVTDIDEEKVAKARTLFDINLYAAKGIDLHFINTRELENPVNSLWQITGDDGYDDVMVFAPIKSVVETADKILGKDGCLNFFAGPTDKEFTAGFNFYKVHYQSTHIVGTSGGNTSDMRISLQMMEQNRINPSGMITHIGGLKSAVEATLNLPAIPGGKKLIYTNIEMPLTAIDDFKALAKSNRWFAALAEIVDNSNGLWCDEAEEYILKHAIHIIP